VAASTPGRRGRRPHRGGAGSPPRKQRVRGAKVSRRRPEAPAAHPRETAVRVLHRVETQDAFAGRLLDGALSGSALSSGARRLVTQLVLGTIRRRLTLDWYLAQCGTSTPESLPTWILVNLRMGVYQLLYLDGIPDFAATHEAVKLARRFGHAGTARYTNAVMRAVIRKRGKLDPPADPIARLSVEHSHPEWIVRRWVDRLGLEDAGLLLASDNEPAPVVLRANTLRTDRVSLMAGLSRRGVTAEAHFGCPESVVLHGFPGESGGAGLSDLPAFRDGLCQAQDPASTLVGHCLGPAEGDRVVDLCAAPGGKTTHIAALMRDRGEIIALDRSARRTRMVVDNCRRLGVGSVTARAADAAEVAPELADSADRVLLDAPCSNMGVLRRRAEARWRASESALPEHAERQARLLTAAGRITRKKGILLYSVCSLEPEENEGVVGPFLQTGGFEPAETPELLRRYLCDDGFIRIWPHKHGMDGMFMARLTKV